jgi:hypothetical protein
MMLIMMGKDWNLKIMIMIYPLNRGATEWPLLCTDA